MPFGRWVVGAIGAIIVIVGLYQLYAAYRTKFEKQFKTGEMGWTVRRWAVRLGRLGYAARGIVYAVIGYLLIEAAWQYNPQKAGGIGQALQTLAGRPYGPWLLAAVALGLICYGAYAEVLARYRRIYF